MQIGQPAGTAQPGGAPATASPQVASLRVFVFALFFTFGGITSLKADGVANPAGDIAFDEEPCGTPATGTIPLQPL